jgi:uncharacterized protein (TIGR01615 family)
VETRGVFVEAAAAMKPLSPDSPTSTLLFEDVIFGSDCNGIEPPDETEVNGNAVPHPTPTLRLLASDADLAALAGPACAFAAAVAAAAAQAADALPAVGGATARALAVAAALRSAGFDAAAVAGDDASGSPKSAHPPVLLRAAARHAFVAVQAPSGERRWSEAALLVDPFFREAFALARPAPEHAALLAALPRVFVGPPLRLCRLLERLAPRLDAAYAAAALTRPPWRSHAALLARWRLSDEEEEEAAAHALAMANDAAAAAAIHAALRRYAVAPLVRVHAYDGTS